MNVASHKLRMATLDDLEALLRLEEKTFVSDRFTRAQYRYLLNRANCTPLVITIGRELVGTAFVLWRRRSKQGHLYTIAVDPDFHGQGIGKKLLVACDSEARRHECNRISLEVRQDNAGAIGLYKKHGYEIVGEMAEYYEDGSGALKMVKVLQL